MPTRVKIPAGTRKGPVHLRFDDGVVFVTAQDSDRFLVAAKKAVEALQRVTELDRVVDLFSEEYLPRLHNWCLEHQNKLAACFVSPPRGPSLVVFVVGKTNQYDFELGKRISQLELDLEDMGWTSDVLQLPSGDDEELRTFFNPEQALQIYAESQPTSGES